MELIKVILSKNNLNRAYKKVKVNKVVSGIDNQSVEELETYLKENGEGIISDLRHKRYFPKPARRACTSKSNGKNRTIGISTVLDRMIQQAIV